MSNNNTLCMMSKGMQADAYLCNVDTAVRASAVSIPCVRVQ